MDCAFPAACTTACTYGYWSHTAWHTLALAGKSQCAEVSNVNTVASAIDSAATALTACRNACRVVCGVRTVPAEQCVSNCIGCMCCDDGVKAMATTGPAAASGGWMWGLAVQPTASHVSPLAPEQQHTRTMVTLKQMHTKKKASRAPKRLARAVLHQKILLGKL